MSYEPLFSVCQGKTDGELLEQLINFYPPKPPMYILDATVNSGKFWKNSSRKIIGLDINTKYRPSICGDNRLMPFKSEAFDLVVGTSKNDATDVKLSRSRGSRGSRAGAGVGVFGVLRLPGGSVPLSMRAPVKLLP